MPQNRRIPATNDAVLETIAESLDISEAQFEEAERRYQAIGNWLNRDGSTLKHYDPQISPQGSFVLGTVVRPLHDRDEFDVDLVCSLDASKKTFTQKRLKSAIGLEVVEYAIAHGMTSPPAEGRRHWTLHYVGDPRFHIDILPALPDAASYRKLLLESGHVGLLGEAGLIGEALAITDRTLPTYNRITDNWPLSNPKGYAAWFRSRMLHQLLERKRFLAENVLLASVDDIPDHRVKTPLQRAIQLLKRHRDWCFLQDSTYKPKSIVVTTLAAHAYAEEDNLAEALWTILEKMEVYIEQREGEPWIPNPVDPTENFARDWGLDPAYPRAFREWLERARKDFRLYLDGSHAIVPDALKAALGKRLVEGAIARLPAPTPVFPAPALVAGVAGADPAARAAAAVEEVRRRGSYSKPWAK